VFLQPGQTYKREFIATRYNNKCPDKFNLCIDCGTRVEYDKEVEVNKIKEIRENNNSFLYSEK
jgi:ribosomal protein S26